MGQMKLVLDESPGQPREGAFEGNISRLIVTYLWLSASHIFTCATPARRVRLPPRRATKVVKCTAAMRLLLNYFGQISLPDRPVSCRNNDCWNSDTLQPRSLHCHFTTGVRIKTPMGALTPAMIPPQSTSDKNLVTFGPVIWCILLEFVYQSALTEHV